MNWKKEAIEKLTYYEARKTATKNIPFELTRLKNQLTSIRSASADGTPVAGGGSGREDAMLSNIVRREELERRLQDARLWCKQVENALAVLSEEDRHLLDAFYISHTQQAAERLAEELHTSAPSIYRARDAALKRFTIALYGRTED